VIKIPAGVIRRIVGGAFPELPSGSRIFRADSAASEHIVIHAFDLVRLVEAVLRLPTIEGNWPISARDPMVDPAPGHVAIPIFP
jgi:hypothetical protein